MYHQKRTIVVILYDAAIGYESSLYNRIFVRLSQKLCSLYSLNNEITYVIFNNNFIYKCEFIRLYLTLTDKTKQLNPNGICLLSDLIQLLQGHVNETD